MVRKQTLSFQSLLPQVTDKDILFLHRYTIILHQRNSILAESKNKKRQTKSDTKTNGTHTRHIHTCQLRKLNQVHFQHNNVASRRFLTFKGSQIN